MGRKKAAPVAGTASNEDDILADKAASGTKWIVDSSDEGQELKEIVVLAATHLVSRWATRGKITARDHWPVAGVLVALGDNRAISSKNGKTDKHESMNACLLRIQRWLRCFEASPDQADEITANINTLKRKESEGTLEWDARGGVAVNLESLKQRLREEVTDLCPRVNDADGLIARLGANGKKRLGTGGPVTRIWSKRLWQKRKEQYPAGVGCSSVLGVSDEGASEKTLGEILLALALQIALKMAVRCAWTIAPTMPCAAHPHGSDHVYQTMCTRPCVLCALCWSDLHLVVCVFLLAPVSGWAGLL